MAILGRPETHTQRLCAGQRVDGMGHFLCVRLGESRLQEAEVTEHSRLSVCVQTIPLPPQCHQHCHTQASGGAGNVVIIVTTIIIIIVIIIITIILS